jgi:OOP family OmpA-OmpF porin
MLKPLFFLLIKYFTSALFVVIVKINCICSSREGFFKYKACMRFPTEKGGGIMNSKSITGAAILCCAVLLVGCATTTPMSHSFPAIKPVPPPTPAHGLKVDSLLVVADVSRSMQDWGKIGTEKAFLSSFNQGIPKGLKNAGMRTFGKSAYDDTILVQPVEQYDRTAMAALVGDLKAGCGHTPLARALEKAKYDLKETQGDIALLIVSDGENLSCDPIPPTLALSKKYGERLCIYTVHIGDCKKGKKALKYIPKHAQCGKAVTAGELVSEEAMEDFIAEIFYTHMHRDTDGDGVLDKDDKCPNTPKGVKVDKVGCPLDSDGDGVPDYLDKCPKTPKGVKVDKAGCPLDSDGDGVPDYLDKCPNTPKGVAVDVRGCWIIKDLKFDYNKWDIKPEYHAGLDNAVHVLNVNPTMEVEIDGHTDSIGSDAYNKTLSEKRASAVKDYLVTKGIDPARLTVKGRGEEDPIASNETPEGRAQNRRVEFKIISR